MSCQTVETQFVGCRQRLKPQPILLSSTPQTSSRLDSANEYILGHPCAVDPIDEVFR